MAQSENINELASALAKAQGKISNAAKSSKNPFFKSNYADLASIWNACRAALSENGLAVAQTLDNDDKGMVLTTTLMHASGQWVSSRIAVNPLKSDPQGMGSAITYMRRYSLAALVGVAADDDDDGNSATGHGEPQKQITPQKQSPTPEPPNADSVPANTRTEALARLKQAAETAKDIVSKLSEVGMEDVARTLDEHIGRARAVATNRASTVAELDIEASELANAANTAEAALE